MQYIVHRAVKTGTGQMDSVVHFSDLSRRVSARVLCCALWAAETRSNLKHVWRRPHTGTCYMTARLVTDINTGHYLMTEFSLIYYTTS